MEWKSFEKIFHGKTGKIFEFVTFDGMIVKKGLCFKNVELIGLKCLNNRIDNPDYIEPRRSERTIDNPTISEFSRVEEIPTDQYIDDDTISDITPSLDNEFELNTTGEYSNLA